MQIIAEISKHSKAELLWVQDEPANQGPWPFLSANLAEHLGGRTLRRVSRRASASPATGSIYVHEEEQKRSLPKLLHALSIVLLSLI